MTLLLTVVKRFVVLITALVSLVGIKTNTVTVDLYANPSSGYSWEYSFDKSGVLTLSDSYYTADTASILTGKGGGTQYFIFKSVNEGTVRVTFSYVKHTGTTVSTASKYVYTYKVSSNGTITQYSIQ